MKGTYYCEDMRTRCLASLGRWPTPVDVQLRFAVLQFEQGQSLSHRTCHTSVPYYIPALWASLTLRMRHWSHYQDPTLAQRIPPYTQNICRVKGPRAPRNPRTERGNALRHRLQGGIPEEATCTYSSLRARVFGPRGRGGHVEPLRDVHGTGGP
jgi:hypothetical protein